MVIVNRNFVTKKSKLTDDPVPSDFSEPEDEVREISII